MSANPNHNEENDYEIYDLPVVDFSKRRGFLRKGEGKLASNFHGHNRLIRKNSFVFDQEQNEKNHQKYNERMNQLIQKYGK